MRIMIQKQLLLGLLIGFTTLWGAMAETSMSQDAQWVWGADDGPSNSWRCFRKELDLKVVPDRAVAQIAADSKYWLWINGALVVFEGSSKRGPTPDATYFDEVDIRPYLIRGQNSISALVWYWGKSGFSHKDSGKGGFYFSAIVDDQYIGSDASWKTMNHPAYSQKLLEGGQPNYRLSESNINYLAADNRIEGWQATDFRLSDDWQDAVEQGKRGASPWGALRKNPIPQWLLSELSSYENGQAFPKFGAGETIVAKLPYNAQVIAQLKVKAPAGKQIDIRTDAYQDGGIHQKKPQYGVRSVYTTKDGVQTFEALAWMSGHEVHYKIPEGVEILELKYRETGYDTEFAGSFHCDDAFYNRLWGMARRTLYVNMRDTFFDCPTRERAQWWGDVVNQLGEVFYTFDSKSHLLVKKGIYNLMEWQRPNGIIASPVPGKTVRELPFQMLNSVGWYGFWTYYMNTGDVETIEFVYPKVKKYLSNWELDEDGLVQHRQEGTWFWVDWGQHKDYGVLENTWYYLAQKSALEMAKLTGDDRGARLFRSNMTSIEDNFDTLWNGEAYFSGQIKGPDGKNKTAPDDRANAMAVLCGLASPDKFPKIKKVLEERAYASPYMEKYVLEALCLMGEEEAALKRMKQRYQVMVKAPYTTLWEFWRTGGMGTYNHGWNAPNTILSQYIAGVATVDAGWKTYQIRPQLGSLNSVQVRVPSVMGNIDVDIKRSDKVFELKLNSPEGTTAIVGIPKKGLSIHTVFVNGEAVWNGQFVSGQSGVAWKGQEEGYLVFLVESGEWTFTTN